jgi:hypothetical protein
VLPASKPPIYRFMFSALFAFGFPPKPYALAAHLALLEEEAGPAPWMIAGLSTDIRPLIGEAVARGDNIRVGLDDAPFRSPMSNLDWVEAAVRTVRDHGCRNPPRRRALASIPAGCLTTYFCLSFAFCEPAARRAARQPLCFAQGCASGRASLLSGHCAEGSRAS